MQGFLLFHCLLIRSHTQPFIRVHLFTHSIIHFFLFIHLSGHSSNYPLTHKSNINKATVCPHKKTLYSVFCCKKSLQSKWKKKKIKNKKNTFSLHLPQKYTFFFFFFSNFHVALLLLELCNLFPFLCTFFFFLIIIFLNFFLPIYITRKEERQ